MKYIVLVFIVYVFIFDGLVLVRYKLEYNSKIREFRDEIIEAMNKTLTRDIGEPYDMVDIDLFQIELKKIVDKYKDDVV